MPPKPEPTPAPAAVPAPVAAPVASSGSKISALIPVILVVVLAPVVSWAVAQFVIIPKMEQRLSAAVSKVGPATNEAAPAAEEPVAAEESSGHGGKKEGGKKGDASGPSNSYEFSNVVVNLAGTMGTRYLKATFLVTGKDPHIRDTFNKDKARLVDVTLNVLSSLSLADLEEAGAKNIIREKLVNAYNQALGKKVVDQIYFSDFVVQ